MRYKDIVEKEVIGIKAGNKIGRVRSVVVDGNSQKVIGLVIEDSEWFLATKIVLFSYIRGIKSDKITIDDSSSVNLASELKNIHPILRENIQPIGLEIISEIGTLIGKVNDFILNSQTGKIETYLIENKSLTIDWRQVIALSKDMLVIKELENNVSDTIAVKPQPMANEIDLNQLFEKRQISFLMGKRLIRDIRSDDGNTIVSAGSVIDQKMVDLIKQSGKFTELSMSVESEE